MPRLVVLGSTNIDLTFRVQRLPRPGETLAATGLLTGHGGKGANQAVMAARLGAAVSMISAVGDDAFGRDALANYRRHGVEVTHVRTVLGLPTGTAGILVDDAAANCIVVVAGANAAVDVEQVRAARPVIESADAVLTQLETPVAAALEAFRLARAAGAITLLNPAPAAPLPDELLALADLCVPNETELAALTGLPAGSLAEVETAARALRGRGAPAVVVTLGARGALLVGETIDHVPAVPVRAVDPTAAGDTFLGALAVFLSEGHDLVGAVHLACAVAALTVTRPGAQSSFPRAEEARSFLTAQAPRAATPAPPR